MNDAVKRFVLFGFEEYYPGGGWNDFIGSYDSIEGAKSKIIEEETAKYASDWYQIIDLNTGKNVLD